MTWQERIRTIERNGESELKQKLPTPASQDNGIKTDVVIAVVDLENQFNSHQSHSWNSYFETNMGFTCNFQ